MDQPADAVAQALSQGPISKVANATCIRSHYVYDGSEAWGHVPEPSVPTENNPSGLGVPGPTAIAGYVYWTRGERGPKTSLQAYADTISALMLAVHPLEPSDCRSPSPADVDRMRKHQALQRAEAARSPAAFTVPLSSVLGTVSKLVMILALRRLYRNLRNSPMVYMQPVLFGFFAGLLYRWKVRRRRQRRAQSLQELAVSPQRWLSRVRPFLLHRRRRIGQGPYWASVRDESEPCKWLNTIIRKMWPVYDHPVCTSVVRTVDPILRNVKPPIFLSLKIHRLKFGSRSPEVVAMRTFSASSRRVVFHARVRFVGDDLQAVLVGHMLTGRVLAGIKNLKINALLRIELSEPIPKPPFFAAVVVSFLEPLAPAFTLRLSTAILPGSVAKSMITPLLMNILQNKVFASLFVWPNRLVVPMNGEDPSVKAVLRKLEPRIKGLLVVSVSRAALLRATGGARPVVGFSVDGVNWYKTEAAADGVNPVWTAEAEEGNGAAQEPYHFLLPLKELDLGLQVAVASGDIDGASGWRDRDSDRILARTTIRLHQLAEGEVLAGWHRLRPREARSQDGMDLAADDNFPWTPTWQRSARDAGRAHMRSMRPEFDRFQHALCGVLGEPLPPMPHVASIGEVRSFRLRDLAHDGELPETPPDGSPEVSRAASMARHAEDSLDAVTAAVTAAAAEVAHVAAAALQKIAASPSGRSLSARRSFHASVAGELPPVDEDTEQPHVQPPQAGTSPAVAGDTAAQGDAACRSGADNTASQSADSDNTSSHSMTGVPGTPPETDASADVSAVRSGSTGSHHSSLHGGSAANVAPHGALWLSVALLRASTLKTHFAVHDDPSRDHAQQGTMRGMTAVHALTHVLRPWRPRRHNIVEGQRGCLFVHVHRAYDLNIWTQEGGFHGGPEDADAYDTSVQLRLASDEEETHTTVREGRTRIVDNARSPEYNGEFEFLAERVSQRLQLSVVVTRALEHGRLHAATLGRASVVLDDLARCPGGKVQRIPVDVVHPHNSAIVTGTLVVSLEWLPINAGPVAPPQRLPLLTETRRGTFFVRVVCAWDLPPADNAGMTCNARVSVVSTGTQHFTRTICSMCPVWIESAKIDYVSEHGEVWLEVQHQGQKTEPIARCKISMADLRHTPNEAVLVTKCLTVSPAAGAADAGAAPQAPEDSDSDDSETSTAPSTRSDRTTASTSPPQLPFSVVSRGFSSGRNLDAAANTAADRRSSGSGAAAGALGGARSTRLSPAWSTNASEEGSGGGVVMGGAATQDELHRAASARAHIPPSAVGAGVGSVDGTAAAQAHPLHNSACGSAMTGYGSLASDAKPPVGVQASGWLMFEVAYRPYSEAQAAKHSQNFTFPPIDKQKLLDEAERRNTRRTEEFKRALPDELALQHWSGGFGAFKQSLAVTAAGNCLRVEVLRGTHMPRMDWTGSADPYVVVTAQSEAGLQMFRCDTAWDTLTPEWGAVVDVWEAHGSGGLLEVQVWDDDRMRGDDHIATSTIDVGRTLIAANPAPQQDGPGCTLYPALPPVATADGAEPPPPQLLPAEGVLTRDVLLTLGHAKHRRGTPRVFLRLTWVPVGAAAPWGGERQGAPLVPWRQTALEPMQVILPSTDAADGRAVLTHTLSAVAAAEVRRGRLAVVLHEVPGGATASRYPKYISVRHNRLRLCKTGRAFHCRFNYALPVLDNASVDDVLQFKFKARGLRKEMLGHGTVAVADLLDDAAQEVEGVPFSLPLQGAGLMLSISFSWLPVKLYSASGRSK
eukprot:jgi/Ulvmu1/3327/UM155_0010.1